MEPEGAGRRLAAIMFTDLVGSTALTARSESAGLRAKERHRALVREQVARYGGELLEAPGDETLSLFGSAVDAVNCALALEDAATPEADVELHIGIHLGDVLVRGREVHGDGVNVAARLLALSGGGGICVSEEVQRAIQNHEDLETRSLGRQRFRNVARPIEAFAVGRPGAIRLRPARARSRATGYAAVAVLLLTLLGAWLWSRGSPAPGPIRSLAVLPLDNLSADPEQQFFADGMTDAVISEFAKIGSLRVISWTSVKQYRDVERALPEIARELDVEGIVEGTILRSGDRVRITLQLIDARDDSHLWAESYERDLRNVLALQGEIARAVARGAAARITPSEQTGLRTVRSVDPGAHDAFLRGSLHLAANERDDLRLAIQYSEQAVERDPGYAEAWALLADAYLFLGWGAGQGAIPSAEAARKSRAAAERAIAIDPSVGRAHAVLGMVLGMYDWRWTQAEAELRRALELSPGDSDVNQKLCVFLYMIDRAAEAVAHCERAVRASPARLQHRFDKSNALRLSGQPELAQAELLQILEADPEFVLAVQMLPVTYYELGRPDEGCSLRVSNFRRAGVEDSWLRGYEESCGRGGSAPGRYWLDDPRPLFGADHVDLLDLAFVSADVGDVDAAIRWLEAMYEERHFNLTVALGILRSRPEFAADPRVQDLLRRINYPGAS